MTAITSSNKYYDFAKRDLLSGEDPGAIGHFRRHFSFSGLESSLLCFSRPGDLSSESVRHALYENRHRND